MKHIFKRVFCLMLLGRAIFCDGSQKSELLIDHVKNSIQAAWQGNSKLTADVLRIDGMSSAKVRHFLNNLCALPGTSYLEIGVYHGSTFIAALYRNAETLLDATAIDNWSEFDDRRNIFAYNTSLFLPRNSFGFYEQDAFGLDVRRAFTRPINIYFYDGNHSIESQRKAFTYFNDAFANTFIAIVDDWSWEQVKVGTRQAFKELGYKILFEEALPSSPAGSDRENWWNGLYVAVIEKPDVLPN